MSARNSAAHWLGALSKLASGQAIVQLLNLFTGVMLLRILPVREYGLFVVANTLVVFASVGSDLNLSIAFTTFGAQCITEPSRFARLYRAVLFLRRRLFAIAAVALVIAAPALLYRQTAGKPFFSAFSISMLYALLALGIAWAQLNSNLRIAVLNIRHDSTSLSICSVLGASMRLVFSFLLCRLWPTSIAAVLAVLLSTAIMSWSLSRYVQAPIANVGISLDEDKRRLWAFVTPLILSAVYFTVQGQLSILLTTLLAPSNSVAEVGALSRLGQIIAAFNMFNGFLFQPMFARIDSRAAFIRVTITTYAVISAIALLLMASAMMYPQLWLLLLGRRYTQLDNEVVLALAGPILTYYVNFTFVILSARAFTKGQWTYVAVAVAVQVIFLALVGMNSTHDALMLGFVTALSTAIVELVLLMRLIHNWK